MTPRTVRRATHAALAAAVMATFASRSHADDPVDVELTATPYGGVESSRLPARTGCAFAPAASVGYGGVGGRARVRLRTERDDPTRGTTVTLQGAAEHRTHTLVEPGSDMQRGVPRDQVMAGGSLAVGHDWRWFGVHAGVNLREVYGAPELPCSETSASGECLRGATYPRTQVAVFPEVALRGGRLDGLHGELGVGAYSPAQTLRPGAYLGVGYGTRAGWGVDARCGLSTNLGGDGQARCDLSGTIPVSERVTLGVGAGAGDGHDNLLNVDGRASVTVRLGP